MHTVVDSILTLPVMNPPDFIIIAKGTFEALVNFSHVHSKSKRMPKQRRVPLPRGSLTSCCIITAKAMKDLASIR